MSTKSENSQKAAEKPKSAPVCGVVMPISNMDDLHTSAHWNKVLRIIKEVISESGFKARAVWEADGVNIIHKNIVQNLYDNDVIICDVSCNNPNVMFELGLRLAFDKPTIVIAERGANLTFDTSLIEHVMYPSSLDYYDIADFKSELGKKLKDTYKKSKDDKSYSVFLKHFREIKPSKIGSVEGGLNEVVLEKLAGLTDRIDTIGRAVTFQNITATVGTCDKDTLKFVVNDVVNNYCIQNGIDRNKASQINVRFETIFNEVMKHPMIGQVPVKPSAIYRELNNILPQF